MIPYYQLTLTLTMRNHLTKKLKRRCENHHHLVDIDIKIAPLIFELWEAGIKTNNSCQEDIRHDGYAWISFNSGKDFEKFVSIICDVDSKIDNDIDFYHYLIDADTTECSRNEKTNKHFMIKHSLYNETDLFYDFESDFESYFKEAKRPILDIIILTSLFIRIDLLNNITKKLKLFNEKKNKGEKKLKVICDGKDDNNQTIVFE